MQAVKLACLTGLRRGDLINLRWGQIGDLVIEKATSKSGGARVAVIPLLSETKLLLQEIGRGTAEGHVLLNSRKQPWTGDGLTHLIVDASKVAKVEKTLHDARGTFATRLRLAGLDRDQIADIMGWKKDRVDRILTRYVDQATVITAMVQKLRENEKKTKTPKRLPNMSVFGRKVRTK
jgi:integrase